MYTKNIFPVINTTPSMASLKSLQYHTKVIPYERSELWAVKLCSESPLEVVTVNYDNEDNGTASVIIINVK